MMIQVPGFLPPTRSFWLRLQINLALAACCGHLGSQSMGKYSLPLSAFQINKSILIKVTTKKVSCFFLIPVPLTLQCAHKFQRIQKSSIPTHGQRYYT